MNLTVLNCKICHRLEAERLALHCVLMRSCRCRKKQPVENYQYVTVRLTEHAGILHKPAHILLWSPIGCLQQTCSHLNGEKKVTVINDDLCTFSSFHNIAHHELYKIMIHQ